MSLTAAQRNAVSELAAVQPLGPGDLIYTPGPPQFSALVASILGNAGTSSDGFDSIFNSIASLVDPDIAGLSAIDQVLTGIDFVTGALDAATFAPIATQYAAFARVGDAALGESDSKGTPPPPPPPPPKGKCGPVGPCIEPPPGQQPPKQPIGGPLCKKRFPYGHRTDEPTLDDPCAP